MRRQRLARHQLPGLCDEQLENLQREFLEAQALTVMPQLERLTRQSPAVEFSDDSAGFWSRLLHFVQELIAEFSTPDRGSARS